MLEEAEEASVIYSIQYGLILTVPRGDYSIESLRSLLRAFVLLGRPKQVVGLDLAGHESRENISELVPHFMRAKKEFGLGVTIHAGETGIIENVTQAVLGFGADRIGHGTAAAKCVETMALLREHDVCLEVCPISNYLTGAVPNGEAHPLNAFVEHEVPFVICSDNPARHARGLNADYYEFIQETGRFDLLDDMYSKQSKYSFLDFSRIN